MSRRQAESEISAGRVLVNGEIAKIGDKINPDVDTVIYNGRVIQKSADSSVYVMLNKPVGYVTTLSDEKGRNNVSELIGEIELRLYPIGRLDMYSDGLLLLSNDGDLTNKLTHPSHNVSKKYVLRVSGEITEDTLTRLRNVTEIDGYVLRSYNVDLRAVGLTDKEGRVYSELVFTLYEGRNREIRKICKLCNVKIIKLTRVSIGDLELENLPVGKWRYLTKEEVSYLKGL